MNKYFFRFLYVKLCSIFNLIPKAVPFPILEITHKCNLNCSYCNINKDNNSRELSKKEWFKVIDSLSILKPAVIIVAGGEPFVREDIIDILEYISNKDVSSHICTNGLLLDFEMIKKLKKIKNISLSVSFNNLYVKGNEIITSLGNKEQIRKKIKMIQKDLPNANLGINCTIHRKNYLYLNNVISFVHELGVKQLKFAPIHTNLSHKNAKKDYFLKLIFNKEDLPLLDKKIKEIIKAVSRCNIITNSHAFLKKSTKLYTGPYPICKCAAGYFTCFIDPYGWVSPCPEFEKKLNVRNNDLVKIWKSRQFDIMRKGVKKCSSPCWSTTYAEISTRSSFLGSVKEFLLLRKEAWFYFNKKKKKVGVRVCEEKI